MSIAFVSTLANFGTVGIPLTFIYYYTLEGAHPLFIGIFASAFGVGVLLGSFLVGPLPSCRPATCCYRWFIRCCGRCAC